LGLRIGGFHATTFTKLPRLGSELRNPLIQIAFKKLVARKNKS
jgi:hypothetical protein